MTMKKRKTTDTIVVHSSATPPKMDIGVEEITRWHKEKGYDTIGYHVVIRRGGDLEFGRPLDVRGAHVKGHNWHTIGVCMIGGVDSGMEAEANFTDEQFSSLDRVLTALQGLFPDTMVVGHRDFAGTSTKCPSFDVSGWWDLHRYVKRIDNGMV